MDAVGKEVLWKKGAVEEELLSEGVLWGKGGCGGWVLWKKVCCGGRGPVGKRVLCGKGYCRGRSAAGCGGMSYLTFSTPTTNNLILSTLTHAQRSHPEHSYPQHIFFQQSHPHTQHLNASFNIVTNISLIHNNNITQKRCKVIKERPDIMWFTIPKYYVDPSITIDVLVYMY